MSGLFCPFPGEAAFPRRSNHKSSTERLPNVGENAQTDLGTARVHPRCEAAEQEPHCSAALPQEEAWLHPEPGVWDQKTGESTVSTSTNCHNLSSVQPPLFFRHFAIKNNSYLNNGNDDVVKCLCQMAWHCLEQPHSISFHTSSVSSSRHAEWVEQCVGWWSSGPLCRQLFFCGGCETESLWFVVSAFGNVTAGPTIVKTTKLLLETFTYNYIRCSSKDFRSGLLQ